MGFGHYQADRNAIVELLKRLVEIEVAEDTTPLDQDPYDHPWASLAMRPVHVGTERLADDLVSMLERGMQSHLPFFCRVHYTEDVPDDVPMEVQFENKSVLREVDFGYF